MRNDGRLQHLVMWNRRSLSLLVMGAAACILPLIIGFISAKMSPTMSQQGAIVLALVFPAFIFAVIQSKALIPYTLVVWAIGPEIRRISDWMEGTYQSVSLLSIAPLLASTMILIPVLRGIHQAEQPLARIALYFAVALGYGSLIGVAKNGMGFAYDLANYIIPLMILPYFAVRPFDVRDIDRLLTTYANIAVAVSLYGIIQYLTVPPWDAFWMNHVEMNSIGLPYPLEIRVFSTLNSPGPCAFFLAGALMPMLMEKRWRGSLGWFGVLLTLVCLMTTLVRSAWLLVFVMLLAYILTSSSKGKWKTILQLVILGALLVYIVPKLPGAEGLVARMETLTSIEEDRSYNDRLDLLNTMLPTVIGNPVGQGLGSVGTGTKLDNGGDLGEMGIMDNGFIAVFLTFGVPGAIFFFAGLFLLAKKLISRITARNSFQPYARLGFAAWMGACANLISDNGFPGLRGYVVWTLIGIGLWAKDAMAERR
ncbi:O-antigen ligase family protein [Paenibacillus sp. P96]|uniref:O-antigen ligase family protein n=1 Tax=Paenibacillus zeirhizosphaerae TaxID=2987519 RepID=A0ABT9FW44_9BACL|nr:O-antigen ligase family protein [Paenibacillus sp. P96]MDP4098953.1 O-antigen ligase family protein [Paenibacillus sp. P96]